MIGNWYESLLRTWGAATTALTRNPHASVTNTATELFLIESPGIYRIYVKNVGATALNTFKIQGRNTNTAPWIDVVSTLTEFTTIPSSIAGFLLVSDDTVSPTTLASAASWSGTIDSKAYRFVRAVATVAAGSTTLNVEVN